VFFVWTAGIARHYDFHPLLSVNKWIWAPFLVAAFTSFLVFCIAYLAIIGRSGRPTPNFFYQYASFYGAFLLTAPIAWLYAIPVEQLVDSDPMRSAQANIFLLAIVSTWRVVLMIRVLSVITSAPSWKILFSVLLPMAVVTFVASFLESLDIVGIMGGVEMTPTQEFKRDAYAIINGVSFWIAAVAFVGIWFPIGKEKRGLGFFTWEFRPIPKGAIGVALLVLVAWIGYAIPYQLNPELREPRVSLEEKATVKAEPNGSDEMEKTTPSVP
jgi:hypothetical protein